MKLGIVSVHGHGDYDKEFVLLKATEDCDLGQYMLADSTYQDTHVVSNKVRNTLWFPDMELSAGDLVMVWTKKGKRSQTDRSGQQPIHHVYWGLSKAVWNDDGDCAILFDIRQWQAHKTR